MRHYLVKPDFFHYYFMVCLGEEGEEFDGKERGVGWGVHCESVPTKCPVSVKKVLLIKSSWVIKERLFPRRQFDLTPIAPAVSAPSPSIVLVYLGRRAWSPFCVTPERSWSQVVAVNFFCLFFFFF